jgi:tetratricopeptide (TPR) repeat protein
VSRARALFAEGEFALALAELESVESVLQRNPEGLRLRAILLATLRPESALPAVIDARTGGAREDTLLADLEAAFRAATGSGAFDYAMRAGQVFLAHGNAPEAARAFQRATELDPSDITARAYLAYAAASTDPQAAARLRALRAEAPDLPLLYLFEAIVLRQSGFPSSALPVLEAAIELDPENPSAWAELGATHIALGEIAQATHDYRVAAQTARSDPAYWRLLSRFSLDHGVDPAGLALPAGRNAVALDPVDAEAWDLLGEAHLRQGDLWLADRVLRTAIQIDPGLPAAHYHFGQVRLALSDPPGARAAFEAVLRIDPEGGYADLARRSLESLAG